MIRLIFLFGLVWGDHGADFDTYDLDHNGLIDPQELRTIYKDLTEEQLWEFWAGIDKKQQGFFNKNEYIAYALGQADNSEM